MATRRTAMGAFFLALATLVPIALGQMALPGPARKERPLYFEGVPIDSLVVYGDSVSDTGNFYRTSKGLWPPPPYYKGRFSDGPIYTEYMQKTSGLFMYNLATGAGTADPDKIRFYEAPLVGETGTLAGQVQLVLRGEYKDLVANSSTLHIIWLAGNDYSAYVGDNKNRKPEIATAQQLEEYASKIVSLITQSIRVLYVSGARNFAVIGNGDLRLSLYKQGSINQNGVTLGNEIYRTLEAVFDLHNAKLFAALSMLKKEFSNARFKFVNLAASEGLYSSFSSFKVTDKKCLDMDYVKGGLFRIYQSICDNPNEYLHWDDDHPTSLAHLYLAEIVMFQLNSTKPSEFISTYLNTAAKSASIYPPGTFGDLEAVKALLPV